MEEAKKFEYKVLLEIYRNEVSFGKFIVFGVVSWRGRRPKLEKRAQYEVNGEKRLGKCMGLDDEDMQLLQPHMGKVMDLLMVERKAGR